MALKTICLLLGIVLACHAYPSTGVTNNFEPYEDNLGHKHNNFGHNHGVHSNQGNNGHGVGGFPNSFGHYPGGFELNKPSFGNQAFYGHHNGGFGKYHGYSNPNKGTFGIINNEFSQSELSPNFSLKSGSNDEHIVQDLSIDESKAVPQDAAHKHGFGMGQGFGGFPNNFESLRPGHFGSIQVGFVQNHGGYGPYNSFGQNPSYHYAGDFAQNHGGFGYAHGNFHPNQIFGPNGLNNFGQNHNGLNKDWHNPSLRAAGEQVEDPSINLDRSIESIPGDESIPITQIGNHPGVGFGYPDFNNQGAFGQENVGQNGFGQGFWSAQNGFGQGFWPSQNGFGQGYWPSQNGFGQGYWPSQNGFGQWQGQNGFGHVHWHGHHGHGHTHEHSEGQSSESEDVSDLVQDDDKPEDDQQNEDNDLVPYDGEESPVENIPEEIK